MRNRALEISARSPFLEPLRNFERPPELPQGVGQVPARGPVLARREPRASRWNGGKRR